MALRQLLSSPIGKKLGMAVSGLILYAFLVGHLTGNLLLFKGDGGRSYNEYSDFLVRHPLLVPAELGLLVLFVLHVLLSISVSRDNLRARPTGYQVRRSAGGRSWASSTMLYSGLLVLAFAVLHLLHFKYAVHTGTLYELVTGSLAKPLYAGSYLFAMVVLGFHLWHSFHSAFQTLGWDGQRFRFTSAALSLLLAGGFGLIPLWACLK
jgi:succinate dehydrogenase / fumarate reductase cytochrome b subunit